MELGLLLVRGVAGLTLAAHGAQKLVGWFGGGGPDGTAAFFDTLALRGGRRTALLAGGAEVLGGVLLALGLLMPVAVALIVAVMAGAALTAHRGKGFFATDGGWEYPFVLAGVATGLAATGPGTWSLDAALDTVWAGSLVALASALAGLVVATATVATLSTARAGRRVRVRTTSRAGTT